jgi:hypothetical protein
VGDHSQTSVYPHPLCGRTSKIPIQRFDAADKPFKDSVQSGLNTYNYDTDLTSNRVS